MKKFIYEVTNISHSIWTGKSDEDYLDLINEKGAEGWRFVGFVPTSVRPKNKLKGTELIFEKVVEHNDTLKHLE